MSASSRQPLVLAGPLLRRLEPGRLSLWLATSAPAEVRLCLEPDQDMPREWAWTQEQLYWLQAGGRLWYLFLDVPLDPPLPRERWIGYRLELRPSPEEGWQGFASWAPDLCYPGRKTPGFRIPERVRSLLHGSCRKPHHSAADGMTAADEHLAQLLQAGEAAQTPWPALLALTGDQIYADDVAAPMLNAIHQLVEALELFPEDLSQLELEGVADDRRLFRHGNSYYRRTRLLPRTPSNRVLLDRLFAGVQKPIFTSDNADNHLVTLGEYLAMYLLVWSPTPWQSVVDTMPPGLDPEETRRYAEEGLALTAFVKELPAVRRVMAHLPVAMIFDDHDISDDWNLNREWEETAYGHPLSRRIIGNGLLAYLLNQGWGNAAEVFTQDLREALSQGLATPGSPFYEQLLARLLRFEGWDYQWPTQPPLVVLDTRTRRWRSESSAHKPSGLLDWEALTELQRRLENQQAVILVSAAPIFGVKLIEAIQRIFTWLGRPLVVDAENWMAHPGTANGILNVFRHSRTPRHFVVLSGDVHYSFVYDVELRGRVRGPDIWQICSSGVRNAFPPRLLDWLDRCNRILYSPRSPLNWFTKRRRLRVIPRKPAGTRPGRRLLNREGMGLVELDAAGRPQQICQLVAGQAPVRFVRREEESRWD